MSEAKKVEKPLSILDLVNQTAQDEDKKLFCIVAGRRLYGKTTLAGTVPGKTVLLQARVLESGSGSAKKLAKRLNNNLSVLNFSSPKELMDLIKKLEKDEEYDNVYIDGVTAVTEQLVEDPRIKPIIKKNIWDGFREVGSEVTDFMLAAKRLTYPESATKAKNVFVTCSLKVKTDTNGNIIDVELEAKGNVAVSQITKLGEAVVTVVKVQTENGEERRLLTKTQSYWPGRIDGILDSDNPGIIEANLGQVLALLTKGE